MANGNGKTGRPRIEIEWKEFDKLCGLQCSEQEIADWFGCSVDTIERRVREQRKSTFAEYFAKHRATGKIAVRRNLFRLSEKQGHVAIFLAKNLLGMTDRQEITGADGAPLTTKIIVASEHDKQNVERVMDGERT